MVGNANNGPIIGPAVLALNISAIFPGLKNISFVVDTAVYVKNLLITGATVNDTILVQNPLIVHIKKNGWRCLFTYYFFDVI